MLALSQPIPPERAEALAQRILEGNPTPAERATVLRELYKYTCWERSTDYDWVDPCIIGLDADGIWGEEVLKLAAEGLQIVSAADTDEVRDPWSYIPLGTAAQIYDKIGEILHTDILPLNPCSGGVTNPDAPPDTAYEYACEDILPQKGGAL